MWFPDRVLLPALLVIVQAPGAAPDALSARTCPVAHATVPESAPRTPDISTEDVVRHLREGTATVFDVRPYNEFAMSHIPGAVNVSAKPGVPISVYVSDAKEIERAVGGNKAAPLILYCNGPHCGKSKRLAEELLAAGFTHVQRYQAGIPVWRAVGQVTEIEASAARRVLQLDQTAVFIDARSANDYSRGSLPGAKNIPRLLVTDEKDTGEVRKAKDDGRLPMEDHNTRIIVFGGSPEEARSVAAAVAREAFHNVSFFAGPLADLTTSSRTATLSRRSRPRIPLRS
jgi:rhodanese-related sulfurtransferase